MLDCNCSICTKKGFLHLIVPENKFTLIAGERDLVEYRFNTGIAVHRFCRTCGIAPYYSPRSHPGAVDVNARCLDDFHSRSWRITPFDGQNWEQNVESIRKP